MHVLDAAEDVARHPVLLLELGLVAVDNESADSELDPVLVVLAFGLPPRRRRVACVCPSVRREAGYESQSAANSAKAHAKRLLSIRKRGVTHISYL